MLAGLPFTLLTLALVAWILLCLDRFRAHTPIKSWLALGFVWGAAAGPAIAMYANDHNMRVIQNLAGDAFALDWQAPISAAIVEEAVKGAGVFAVAWLARPLLTRPMHGLLLGGCTGLGFQIIEDVTYEANGGVNTAQGDLGTAMLVGVLRLATGITSHWMLTGLAGIGIVVALGATGWSRARRCAVFAGFYLLGAALHFGWDAPQPENAGLADMVRRAVLYLAIFAVVYGWVLRTEKRWFRRTVAATQSEGLAPRGELDTLLTRRDRRQARRAGGSPRGRARRRQRELMDWVQAAGLGMRIPFGRSGSDPGSPATDDSPAVAGHDIG
nr:PrsW family glutamic-type intramembrane protease [Nocardia transvalensis]